MLIAEGVIRPNMTFFGEGIDTSYYDRLDADKHAVDLVIIIGTSLVVEPLASLPLDTTIAKVPQIYISKSPCPASRLPDIELLGECDLIVEALARRAGWKLQHNMMLEDGAEVRIETLEGYEHKHLVRRLINVPINAKTRDLGLAAGSRATPPISQP
jgi:NAD+-dependent protein deacetylase SIR2